MDRENRKRKMPGRGGHGGGRIVSYRERSDRRNFNSRNNLNKNQELKIYPHGTGTDQQTATFTKFARSSNCKD